MGHPNLIDDYIAYWEASRRFGADSRQAEMWWWAWEEVTRLVHKEPEKSLEVIKALVSAAPNDDFLSYVAAGPLENLLCYHGDAFIGEVERAAAKDEKFRRALSGVWGENHMSPSVHLRLIAAVGDLKTAGVGRVAIRHGYPPSDRIETLQLFTDGASRGNPGHAGIGIVLVDEQGERLFEWGLYFGKVTNNQAEYHALIEGLKVAQLSNPTRLDVNLDSEVVVKQMNGGYRVKDRELKLLHEQATKLRDAFNNVAIRHIGRAQNKEADTLANKAIDDYLRIWERKAAR